MNLKILFARVWGALAILLGLFFAAIAIYNFFKPDLSTEELVVYIPLFGGGVIFVLLGRFFLFTKMSDK